MTIDETILDRLLKKLVNEQAVMLPEELAYLKQVFDSYEGRLFIECKMQKTWQQQSMSYYEANFDQLYARIERLLKGEKKEKRIVRILRQCAAILFIPLLGFSVFLVLKPAQKERLAASAFEKAGPYEQEYYIPAGNKSKITLSDSTCVWLNSGSRLIVENGFGNELRKVRLAGEAYFEVSRNEQQPFIVQTYDMDVKVLGTTFNLSAYPDNNLVEAVLVEGSVEVDTKEYSAWWQKKTTMQPAQKLALNKSNNKITLESNVQTDFYTAWKDNRLIYQDTPMEEVAKSLERWFNIVVILKDKEIQSYTYTGKFEDRSLSQILNFIQLSSPIEYNMVKDTVTMKYKYL